MDIKQAKHFLKLMSKGINPVTGELLADNDCCMQPEVNEALKMLLERIKLTLDEKGLPSKHGEAWTNIEDDTLCALFEQGKHEEDIAIILKRSRNSIHARLLKFGKIGTNCTRYLSEA